ncbi:MAG: pro-sigmaK processing inhibitor BofA family protein [Candidatus Onthomonas sp.]
MTIPLTGILLLILALILLHRWLYKLAGLALRTLLGALFLHFLSLFGGIGGLTLGVNLFNALVLGVLGVPGLGLLLMLRWTALWGL